MEMHQIRYFLAICECLNFTRAAEQCHVAQPSLTRAIKKLEAELGGPLLRRERNHTHLTELGRLIRPHLEQIHESAINVQAQAEDYCQMQTAPLRLGVMCTIGPLRLVGFFDLFRKLIPRLELSMHEATGQQLVDQLLGGEIDIALIGLPNFPERLAASPLYEERYVIAFRIGHRFESMNTVPIRELDGEDYLERVNCEFNDHYGAIGEPVPFAVKVRYRSEREDWVQAMILAGMGCAVMPEFLPIMPGLTTRTLMDPEMRRTIHLVTVRGRRFSPTVEAFVRLARRYDWKAA